MNCDPCMDRFSQPWPVVKCECLCGAVLIEGEYDGANCSACGAVVCEHCSDVNHCHHGDCENVYCDNCAEKFLPAEDASVCVPCVNAQWRHQHAAYQRLLAAMMEPLGRTG